jgi:hypothetical protein
MGKHDNGSREPADSASEDQRIELLSADAQDPPEGETNMGPVFSTVVQFLSEEDWNYNVLDGEDMLTMGFQGQSGSWRCLASVDEERDWLTFYSALPASVPPEKRQDIAEFIARVNFGLVLGNFELDFDDGEVRFKTSIDVEGGDLTTKMVENLIYSNVLAMDRYFPGLMAVLYGNKSAQEALELLGCREHDCHEECDDDCEEEAE